MKILPINLISIILICTVTGCLNRHNEQWQKIATADSLMFILPDSALKIISQIHDIENSDSKTRAYYYLINTQAKSRNATLSDTDSSIFKAVDYYTSSKSDYKKLAWSLVYASEVNEKAGNDSLALKYIREAASIAENEKLNDGLLNTFIYNFWGNVLFGKQPYNDAIDKYLIAEKYAQANRDTSRVITALMSVGEMYLWNHEYEMGRIYLERTINFINVYPKESKRLPRLYERISTSYQMEGDKEKALNWISKAISSATNEDFRALWNLQLCKAVILTELDILDSIPYYLNTAKSEKYAKSYSNQALFELVQAKYDAKRGDYKAAYDTHVKYSALLDSMYIEKERNRVAEFQRRYDYQDVALERDRIEIESQANDIRWLWIAVGLLTLALVAICYAYSQRRKRINVEIARDKSINSAVTSMEERMRHELLRRDRHIESLRNRVIMMDNTLDKIRMLRDASPKERVANSAKFMMTDSEMEHMLSTVNICHEGFVDGLREEYSTLADKDIELCALIRLGLQSRDIALLMGMSDNTLKTRKKRLKKEKFSEDMGDMQFDEWIISKNYGKPTDDY